MADRDSGLQLIDVSDPRNPRIVGSCDTPESTRDVYVQGTYAYVADGCSGLQVIKILKPLTDVTYIDSSTITSTIFTGFLPGTYNLHVTNPDGEHEVFHNAFTFCEGYYYPLEIKAGWSMISIPLNQQDVTAADLFPGVEVIYGYERVKGYVRVTEEKGMELGRGYCILLNEAKRFTLTGQYIYKYNLPVYEEGWAMIGGCTSSAKHP